MKDNPSSIKGVNEECHSTMRFRKFICLFSIIMLVISSNISADPPINIFRTNFSMKCESRILDIESYDLDNDGKIEIITSNSPDWYKDITTTDEAMQYLNSSTVDIFKFNNLENGWELLETLRTDCRPHRIAIGDLDKDGIPDIVTSNGDEMSFSLKSEINITPTFSISVLKGNTQHGYSPKVDYPFEIGYYYPPDLALADMDNDGYLDIITTDCRSTNFDMNNNGVIIFYNDGNGTFSNQTKYYAGNEIYAIEIADMNSDSYQDIIVLNGLPKGFGKIHYDYLNGTITILQNERNREFTITQELMLPGKGLVAKVGDINQDGMIDIVALDNGLYNNTRKIHKGGTSVWINIDNGKNFMLEHLPSINGWGTPEIEDVNRDNKPDICIPNPKSINESSQLLIVYGQIDNNSNSDTYFFSNETALVQLTLGDINNDSYPDMITCINRTIIISLNDGHGHFYDLQQKPATKSENPNYSWILYIMLLLSIIIITGYIIKKKKDNTGIRSMDTNAGSIQTNTEKKKK
jgi:hypothetical protein